jgi:hypothetical protein
VYDWLIVSIKERIIGCCLSRKNSASIYIVGSSLFLDFSTTQNVCLFLVTLNDKLHLVSIENTVVKNKREQQQQTSERTKKSVNA